MKKKKKLITVLKSPVKLKKILKKSKTVYQMPNKKPEEYVRIYFKDEFDETKRSMFFE